MDRKTLQLAQNYTDEKMREVQAGEVSEEYLQEQISKNPDVVNKVTKEDVNASVNERLDESGVVNSKTSLINVVEKYGIDNKGKTDVADSIQTIFDNSKSGENFYFPTGTYLLSHGLIIKKHISIIGDEQTYNNPRSVFKFSEEAIGTMITTNDYIRVTIKHICLNGNSAINHRKQAQANVLENTYDNYLEITRPEVNGLHVTRYGSNIDRVVVMNCSGYGIFTGTYNHITNCTVMYCGKGFKMNYDNTLIGNKIIECQYGFYIDKSTSTNTVSTTRFDGIQYNAIYYNAGGISNIFTDMFLDKCGESAIYITKNGSSSYDTFTGNIERSGQYYRGRNDAYFTDLDFSERQKASFITVFGTVRYAKIDLSCRPFLATDYSNETLISPLYTLTIDVENGSNSPIMFNGNTININGGLNIDNTLQYVLNNDTLKYFINVKKVKSASCSDISFNDSSLKINGKKEDEELIEKVMINGLTEFSSDLKNVSPICKGQKAIYNNALYFATGTKKGNWAKIADLLN